jgi:hypothetical protein
MKILKENKLVFYAIMSITGIIFLANADSKFFLPFSQEENRSAFQNFLFYIFDSGILAVIFLLPFAALLIQMVLKGIGDLIKTPSMSDVYYEEINRAIQQVGAEPEKAKPAWDLGRVKLEMYFDRNLSQINYIFMLSVAVLIIGFGFILYGVSHSISSSSIDLQAAADILGETENPDVLASIIAQSSNTSGSVATLAGVVTEFIGATFLFIYRSTITQATAYTETLERIHSVGMAMQILDTISDESLELQDKTKSEMVKLLLNSPGIK